MIRFMLKQIFLVALIIFAGGNLPAADNPSPRERVSFNDNWRFTRGDPEGVGASLSYTNIRAWLLPAANAFRGNNPPAAPPDGNLGGDISFAQAGFDDRGWRRLNLPHDWGIEGPFAWELPGESGKLPWAGVGWYRKHFNVTTNDMDRRLTLEIDGAMAYAVVWLNSRFVGGWPYGYASWQLDLTPFVNFGGNNVLAIRLDNPPESSRWYPGSGLYRNVWLTKTAPVHVARWGTYLTTPQVSRDAATIAIQVKLKNDSAAGAEVAVETTLCELDAKGNKSKSTPAMIGTAGLKLGPGNTVPCDSTITIPKPRLWSVTNPQRYAAVTTVKQAGKVIDVYETPFGIRTIQFTTTNGFLLNGERVPLHGVCNHHDLGALGTAFNLRAAERQLEILRAMGGNAIRTSHNPPAPELLDLCDRLGFVVMDEAFDAWKGRKKRNDYTRLFPDWHEADVRALVRRDRNHPSIILWSIGNEVAEQTNTNRFNLAEELASLVRAEDATRPVTAGCNQEAAGTNGFQKILDVFGYNYKPQLYAEFREKNTAIPLYSSESASTISSRGEYFFPVVEDKLQGMADFQMNSYDLYAPEWATLADTEFKGQDSNKFVAGEFVWTGFDYLGEPTPYTSDLSNLNNYSNPADRERAEKELKEMGKIRTPSRSSYFGIVDLAGFPKDRYYLYQARWRPELPMAHLLPHWTWPGREGEVTPVHVYTSGDEAELFLNGKSLGRKKKGAFEYRLRWDDVKYQPGTLKVVAYKNGKRWATDVRETTSAAKKLALKADRSAIAADGKDLSFVTVSVNDRRGRLVPRAKNHLRFELSGPGEIVAVDNGDATSFEPFRATERNAYNGLALVIIRATSPGKIKLKATAEGLSSATLTIQAQASQSEKR
jgi:beta-galactosidase